MDDGHPRTGGGRQSFGAVVNYHTPCYHKFQWLSSITYAYNRVILDTDFDSIAYILYNSLYG